VAYFCLCIEFFCAEVVGATSNDVFLVSAVIMAALRSRCAHSILPLWFILLCSFFLFFIAYSQRSEIGCLPYFHTWYGLSATLECRSEMRCTQLKIQDAKIAQKSPSAYHHITQLCWAISSQLRRISAIEKNVKQRYLLSMSSQHREFRPTNGWDRLASLGHPSKFQRVSLLRFLTAPTSLSVGQSNFARCLAVSWAATLYMHFWELLPRNGILPVVKFTLRPSLACSYIGSVTARHSSSGR